MTVIMQSLSKLITLILFHCLLFNASAAMASANGARITGVIADKKDRVPLAHAQVFISALNRGDVTNERGEFHISNLPAGQHKLTVRLQGYQTYHFSPIVLASNESLQFDVALTSTIVELSDVTVTATRSEVSTFAVPQFVSMISPREIQQRNAQQTPELLREEAGVVIQKTNQGGGSPIIRGLKANKLLLLVDGIRLNNATYRGGNTQYLNTVDAGALERMEIVQGPVSVLYGSDALGGVVNMITQSPDLSSNAKLQFNSSVAGSISTADNTKTSHANMSLANNRFGLQINGAVRSFGDVERGGNGGRELMQRLQNDSRTSRDLNKKQAPNGYNAYDVSARALFIMSGNQQISLAYQQNHQKDVPRYDVVEVRKDSLRFFAPQERNLAYIKYTYDAPTFLFDKLNITLSSHRQFERRLRLKFGSVNLSRDQFSTRTLGAQLQLNRYLKGHNLVYGFELYHDDITTKSTRRNTITEETSDQEPLFPNGSSFLSLGAFVQDQFQVLNNLYLTTGLRFSKFKLRAPFLSDPKSNDFFGDIEQNSSALTASLGTQYFITDELGLVANIAQGFRMPNLDDASKIGPGKGASFYDVPNPRVNPEKSLSFDAGLKLHLAGARAEVVGFYNRLTDLLVRQPALFEGAAFILDEGDTLAVFHKENAGRAFVAGLAVSTEFRLSNSFSVLANLTFSSGQDLSNNEPLSGIPPLSGLLGLRWQYGKLWSEINSRFARKQARLSSEDKLDLRIPEGGTPGWYSLNLRVGGEVTQAISLNLSVSNILDMNYREHLSGMNALGRNFSISARVSH